MTYNTDLTTDTRNYRDSDVRAKVGGNVRSHVVNSKVRKAGAGIIWTTV